MDNADVPTSNVQQRPAICGFNMLQIGGFDVSPVPSNDEERKAVISQTQGFHIRHPPEPHLLSDAITKDQDLFQTIHMGAVDVDIDRWLLVIDGLVERPFALTYEQLLKLPLSCVQSIHECFGSPLAPATNALWRVGNVVWTGVPLRTLLEMARPHLSADFVWSEGLDSGTFAGVVADRYQKDLPLDKARSDEVLVAYRMNGQPLGRERGGPVRLVVPGWFGTNSTKWLCKISLREGRASGPYTTRFYNTQDMDDPQRTMKPVWDIDVNSMIVRPAPDVVLKSSTVDVEGWAWSPDGVGFVDISSSAGNTWQKADLEPRIDFRWQRFTCQVDLGSGEQALIAKATSMNGMPQALSGRRNRAHQVHFRIAEGIV
jgi:DMSO/TMAO reductase YedYZ molybdopterin-dependent catalytic subunit